MAIAFDEITGVTELRAPANPVAVKGNVAYTRSVEVIIPADTTAETLPLGLFLEPGTLVIAANLDTDTTFGATATLALSTPDSTFVVAKVLAVLGGEACVIAANKGLVVPSSDTVDGEVSLVLAAADSPATETKLRVSLVCVGTLVKPGYTTFDT